MHVRERAGARPFRLAAAILGIVAFAMLAAFMWHSNRPMHWERPIIDAVDRTHVPFAGFWIGVFQPVPFTLATLALGCIAAASGRVRLAIPGVVACFGAVLAAEVVFKPLVDRYRTHRIGPVHVIRVGGTMFPSVHVTAAAAWAMLAWLILERRVPFAWLIFVVPFLVGGAAISEELHYPADIIGGILLGTTFVYCFTAGSLTLARRFTAPERARPLPPRARAAARS